MISLTDLPLSFWAYALETTAFTLNKAPSKSFEMTLYELWFGNKPNLSFLKVWGCDVYMKKLQPVKLEPKAEKCIFIGYPKKQLGTPSITDPKAKFSLLRMDPFWRRSFSRKVGILGR
jgi:hypothetical protein